MQRAPRVASSRVLFFLTTMARLPLSPIAVLPPIRMVVGVRPTYFYRIVLYRRRHPRWRMNGNPIQTLIDCS